MKLISKCSFPAVALCLALGGAVSTSRVNAQEATNTPDSSKATPSEADKAWAETEQSLKPPVPPAEWRERRPSEEEVATFREAQGKLATQAATKAREFYTKYPDHKMASEAKNKEHELLQIAVQLGNKDAVAALNKLEQAKLDDPSLSEDERFELRAGAVQRSAMAKSSEGREAVMVAFESGARDLIKEFPKRDEPYQMLLSLARAMDDTKARTIAQDIVNSSAPDQVKESAKGILKSFDALGKPLAIKFTALDGREVDLSAMKGKVVLVDFWATWCSPCVAELPKVKKAYADLHPKGFEIVGISFDKEKDALTSFVKEEGVTWPQYFDGKFWANKYGTEYGIQSIPTMWLVNKQGNLVDMNGRDDLAKKVEKLLAE